MTNYALLLDIFWNDQYNINIFWNGRFKIARPKEFDRDKALLQAMRLFWRKGYAATSVEDLVEALNLSRSSLYDTFGDKRALFLSALRTYTGRVIADVERMLSESPSPLEGIQRFFEYLASGVGTETGAMGCFVVNSVAELVPYDDEVNTITALYSSTVQRLLTHAFQQAARSNQITQTQTPEQLAAYVFNTIQGMRILIKSGATKEHIQAISAMTLRSLQ